MQVATVILGDPDYLASQLTTLAASYTLVSALKTKSSGSFVIIYDDAAPGGQSVEVLVGDPEKVANDINDLIGLGATIDFVSETFSAAHYVVVYT